MPQHAQAIVRENGGIESIDALMWRRSRVRRPACERNLELGTGHTSAVRHALIYWWDEGRSERVRHEAGIDVLVGTGIDELDLAAAPLLSRRTQRAHATLEVAGVRLHRRHDTQECRQRASADEVVPASVPDVRQRVVLDVEGHHAPAAPELGQEGRLEPESVRSDLQALSAEEGRDVVMGLEFLVAELGVLMDL